jgi:hypothetical protein
VNGNKSKVAHSESLDVTSGFVDDAVDRRKDSLNCINKKRRWTPFPLLCRAVLQRVLHAFVTNDAAKEAARSQNWVEKRPVSPIRGKAGFQEATILRRLL